MANKSDVAARAAAAPSSADIERVEAFAREPLLAQGESPDALAPGTARRRALDDALREIEGGAESPSIEWRREFSLMLGLERLLAVEQPVLVDGTELSAHQVDALSGTLAALMAELERVNGNGAASAAVEAELAPDAAELELGDPDAAVGDELAEQQAGDDDYDAGEAEEGEDEDDYDADADEDEDEDDEDADPYDAVEDEEAEAAEVEPVEPIPDVPLAEDEEPQDWVEEPGPEDGEIVAEAPEDPGAARRFWFEHATGAGKTVAAVGFVEASRTGGVLILTHRRNLVDQFIGEISGRGYKHRLHPPLLDGKDHPYGPVTVETYQWFVRNAGRVSDAYSIVICDEAHTALGEKTSACIRRWQGPVFVGMTATGALIARHVTDLFPTQTSRFDLAQAARRGVISPLRCIRIPPGPGVRTIAKVPLRKGEVDQDFDQEELAALLDQAPFNMAIADLYQSRFRGIPAIVYTAGVRHAKNVAIAFREAGINAQAVSGETPKKELAEILAGYERGEVDVLCNAMLLAEGWNSPRATICMHLAPTASRRVYQQRVGRVTRRHPGKESGLVIDFVHPATRHDETIVTLHSLLDRDVYRGGAIVVGPVRRGRGRKVRVERRVLPVAADEERRVHVFERELWRIAVENLDYSEQHVWAALAGARVNANGWRRARAMLQHDESGELRRRFLLTCIQRNRTHALRVRALQEVAVLRDADVFDQAIDVVGTWTRDERREGVKVLLGALAERRIGRRDQAQAWVWRLASFTRDVHEEYAVQRWPETKRLLGLLVNSSGGAHARNARRLVHAARKQDRRLATALLAASVAHTPEAEEVLRGARMRSARKPAAVARDLMRNFPKGGKRRRRRKKNGRGRRAGAGAAGAGGNGAAPEARTVSDPGRSGDNGAEAQTPRAPRPGSPAKQSPGTES